MIDPASLLVGGATGATLAALVRRGREHRPEPAALADELNWAFLVDDGVVLQTDGALLAGFRYRGPDLGSATGAELQALAAQLGDALLPYTDGWMFHVDAIRSPATPYPEGRFPNRVAAWIDAERREAFRGARAQFTTEHVLCATYLPPREAYGRMASLFVSGAVDAASWRSILGEYSRAIDTLAQRLAARLHLERLGPDAFVSHLHRCLTGLAHPVQAPPTGAYLGAVLASQEVLGGFTPRVGDLHLRLVAITAYPPRAGTGSLDFLGGLPFAYRWSSRFIPVGQPLARRLIRRQQRKWFMGRRNLSSFVREVARQDGAGAEWRRRQEEELFNDRDATDMARDAADALAECSAGQVRFGFSTQVVVVMADDPTLASANAATVRNALQDRGFPARIESVNAMDAFFGTLPGHGTPNLRRPLVHTGNLPALWPVTTVWPGLAANPSRYFPAGSPPLMHVATEGSTPFRLNLHVEDVGHTLVVGSTGGGKSTFVGLTVAQWMRYPGARTFVFDVGRSNWLAALAMGSRHHDVGDEGTSGFQPLADVDEPAERAWAVEWLETLFETAGLSPSAGQRLRIERALTLLARQEREFRTLDELALHLQDEALVDALRPYLVGGALAGMLDASGDPIGSERHQVFELRSLLAMGDRVLVPVLLHLFRRVERQLDGSPTLIIIEELWAPLLRSVFARRIRQWLLTLRKQNAAVMLVAHSLAQLEEAPVRQVLIESCPTRVLLPNPEAGSVANVGLYRDLGLNDREIATIASARPKRDYYVRSPNGSRLVTLDLGPVALAFLSTPDGATVDALRPTIDRLVRDHGPLWPERWLERSGVRVPEPAALTDSREEPTHVAIRDAIARPPHDEKSEESSYANPDEPVGRT